MPAANIMAGANVGPLAPHSNYAQTPIVPDPAGSALGLEAKVIDGTPLRVATIVVVTIGGLVGLRWLGYKFNVTVG